jgi:hypothetical protein
VPLVFFFFSKRLCCETNSWQSKFQEKKIQKKNKKRNPREIDQKKTQKEKKKKKKIFNALSTHSKNQRVPMPKHCWLQIAKQVIYLHANNF